MDFAFGKQIPTLIKLCDADKGLCSPGMSTANFFLYFCVMYPTAICYPNNLCLLLMERTWEVRRTVSLIKATVCLRNQDSLGYRNKVWSLSYANDGNNHDAILFSSIFISLKLLSQVVADVPTLNKLHSFRLIHCNRRFNSSEVENTFPRITTCNVTAMDKNFRRIYDVADKMNFKCWVPNM